MTQTVYNVHLKINVHHKSVWYILSVQNWPTSLMFTLRIKRHMQIHNSW